MKNKRSLLTSNKYLRNTEIRERLIVRHAAASAKIGGVKNALQRASRIASQSRLGRSV